MDHKYFNEIYLIFKRCEIHGLDVEEHHLTTNVCSDIGLSTPMGNCLTAIFLAMLK